MLVHHHNPQGRLRRGSPSAGLPAFELACGWAAAVAAFALPGATAASPIVTGTDQGAGPHVKSFDGQSQALQASFFAYSPGFTGGVRVAAGDVNGDGRADLITGTGAGADHVKVFDGTRLGQVGSDGVIADSALLRSFFAYGGYQGGVFVAAGDVTGDGLADLITGTDGTTPGGHVKVFDAATGAEARSFLAFPGFTGGVRVGAGDVNGDDVADIFTGTGPLAPGAAGGGGHVKVFDGMTGAVLHSFLAYGTAYSGGTFVAGETAVIPEPAIGALLGALGAGLLVTRRSRKP